MALTRLSKGLVQPDLLITGFRNKLINGSFDIWQRGESLSRTSSNEDSGYHVDRFRSTLMGTMECDFTKESDDSFSDGSSYARITVTTADTDLDSTDHMVFEQRIEGYTARAFRDVPFSLSFWVRSSMTGTFGASVFIFNQSSYTVPLTINQADTWEYKKIEGIPPLSSVGASPEYGNLQSMNCVLAFAAGTDYITSVGSQWQAGNTSLGVDSLTNFMATAGTTIDIGEIQLEPGNVCTPFEHRPIAFEEMLCQRYFEGPLLVSCIRHNTGSSFAGSQPIKIQLAKKRATPTYSFYTTTSRETSGLLLNGSTVITTGFNTNATKDYFWLWNGEAMASVGEYIDGYVDVSSEL